MTIYSFNLYSKLIKGKFEPIASKTIEVKAVEANTIEVA